MKLTWFGHSAFRVEFGNARVLIDPFLTGNPSFKGDPKEAAAGATHVLVTHGHNDHLGDAISICKEQGAMLVACAEIGDWAWGQGITNVNLGNHSGTVDCGGFTVSFVNALHSSSWTKPNGEGIYLGNPLGLVVKAAGESTLYHMGDTGIFGDMALVHQIHQPKVGIVPVGDRFTMGGDTAALACRLYFKFDRVIPCHYATFPVLDQSPDKFIREMGTDGRKVTVPKVGEPFEV